MSEFRNRFVVSKADHVGGDPIPPDEPVLVIRAQDVLALEMLDDYIDAYNRLTGRTHALDQEGGGPGSSPQADVVRERLVEHRAELVRWQKEHPDRMKVAD